MIVAVAHVYNSAEAFVDIIDTTKLDPALKLAVERATKHTKGLELSYEIMQQSLLKASVQRKDYPVEVEATLDIYEACTT